MTTRQTKPRMLSEYDLWSQTTASLKAWDSEWVERNTKLAIRQGGVCGFCGYSPEKQTDEIRNKRLRRLTQHELLRRHIRDYHLGYEGDRKVMAWVSNWSERKTNLAIQEGWKCGFCGFSPAPEFELGQNPTKKQVEDMKRKLLQRHMRAHIDNNEGGRRWWHRRRVQSPRPDKPKVRKP